MPDQASPMHRHPQHMSSTLQRTRNKSIFCGCTPYLLRTYAVNVGTMKRNKNILTTAVSVKNIAPVEILRPNRTEAYCIRTLRVVYLKMPTRNAGIVNKTFLFESAFRIIEVIPRGIFIDHRPWGVDSSPETFKMGVFCSVFLTGWGMSQSRNRHSMTDPMAIVAGIQGEMSVVTDARKEAISSAM
jgi:hypothetical protein